jgi:cytochrome c5
MIRLNARSVCAASAALLATVSLALTASARRAEAADALARRPFAAAKWVRVLGDSTPLYTEEQATTGTEVFKKVCVECHEKADITNVDFRGKWNGRTLYDLYELVRSTMPDSNPGSLSREEYAGALAYILKLNGLPAGTTAVMPDSAAMTAAKLDLAGPPPPSL